MSISINNNKLLKRRQCRPSFKLNAYQTDLPLDCYIQNRTRTVILSTSLCTNRWAAYLSGRRYVQGFREYLAPCDFYVFPKMKLRLKGRRFASIEEVQAQSQQMLNTLMPADLSECFQKWQNRWDHCIQAQGDYFEGDGGN